MKTFLFILCLFGLSCESPSEKPGPFKNISSFDSEGTKFQLQGSVAFRSLNPEELVVIYDSDRKVTCYVVSGYNAGAGGVFCLRDEVASSK